MNRRLFGCFVAVFMLFAGYSFAQAPAAQPQPPRPRSAWKFEFTVSEIEKGKTVNERTYFMMLLEGGNSESIRSGNQVPVVTTVNNTTTTSYLSFGLKIVGSVQEIQSGVFQSRVDFEISSLVPDQRNSGGNPLVRSVGGSSTFMVQPGKKEVVIGADDVNTDRRYQVAVLATRLN